MTQPYDPGPLDTVGCEASGARWTLSLTRGIDHPPQRLWPNLTRPEQLDTWAPYTVDRPLSEPGAVELRTIGAENRSPSQVLTADEPHLLEHSWDVDVLRWELTPTPHGTRLQLRHTFDDRAAAASIAAGWHLCLNALVALLDGNPMGPVQGQHAKQWGWDGLQERYAELLGIYQAPGS